jgi:hypothetical protein
VHIVRASHDVLGIVELTRYIQLITRGSRFKHLRNALKNEILRPTPDVHVKTKKRSIDVRGSVRV